LAIREKVEQQAPNRHFRTEKTRSWPNPEAATSAATSNAAIVPMFILFVEILVIPFTLAFCPFVAELRPIT
jgi:hypothetical protein